MVHMCSCTGKYYQNHLLVKLFCGAFMQAKLFAVHICLPVSIYTDIQVEFLLLLAEDARDIVPWQILPCAIAHSTPLAIQQDSQHSLCFSSSTMVADGYYSAIQVCAPSSHRLTASGDAVPHLRLPCPLSTAFLLGRS